MQVPDKQPPSTVNSFREPMAVRYAAGGSLRLAGVDLTNAAISEVTDFSVSLIIVAALAVYLFLAFRRAFDDGVAPAIARAAGVAVLFFPIIFAYRFLLFFVTLWAMH